MDMEFGEVFMEIHLLVNGKIVKHKDMGYIIGLMVTVTKVSGKNVFEMVMELIFSQMVMFILVNINKESPKALECINGQMEILTKESFRME